MIVTGIAINTDMNRSNSGGRERQNGNRSRARAREREMEVEGRWRRGEREASERERKREAGQSERTCKVIHWSTFSSCEGFFICCTTCPVPSWTFSDELVSKCRA